MIGDSDSFKVHALNKGEYSHTFTIQHKSYPGLFDKEIVVNFHVISIPSKLTINNKTLSVTDKNGVEAIVYNTYPRGSYGTKFSVNTDSNFGYFVYMSKEDAEDYGDEITLRRNGDGSKAVLATFDDANGDVEGGKTVIPFFDEEGGIVGSISSFKVGANYTTFRSSDSFFLSHSLETLPKEPVTLYVGIIFSMAHSSYSEDLKNSSFTYSLLSFPINVTFENGIDSIELTQSKYYVNLDMHKLHQ